VRLINMQHGNAGSRIAYLKESKRHGQGRGEIPVAIIRTVIDPLVGLLAGKVRIYGVRFTIH
jgi:hypothetical protein